MRKLATVQKIAEIKAIEGADKICAYRVGGWWVVDGINKYEVDSMVIYCEIDSFIPNDIAPFLTKAGHVPKEYNGIKGERLRTIKLKGQVSQGLLLPYEIVQYQFGLNRFWEGDDVSEYLNIQKWEAPISPQLQGQIKGNFPSFIRKTDQERIQNLNKEIELYKQKGYTFEVSEKLDGSSMTVYFNNGEFGVCSRNLDLKEDENNTFWKTAKAYDLKNKLEFVEANIAIQGELIGEGIQKNPYGISGHEYHVFDIWDIDNQCYLTPIDRAHICKSMELKHTPVMQFDFTIEGSISDILVASEDKSALNAKTEREGLVFKCNQDSSISFKAISNKFLLKGGE